MGAWKSGSGDGGEWQGVKQDGRLSFSQNITPPRATIAHKRLFSLQVQLYQTLNETNIARKRSRLQRLDRSP